MKYVKNHGTELIRVLTLTKNRGKGGAVRLVNKKHLPKKSEIRT
jgi:hypothetical protein